MKISAFALKNWQFCLIIVLLLAGIGAMSYVTMPRAEDPTINFAGSAIVAVMPGASPLDMEELVVKPIEERLNELEHVKKLTSSSEVGFATINIEFDAGQDPDKKAQEVSSVVERVRPELPKELMSLDLRAYSSSDVNIFQIALVSPIASDAEFKHQAEELKKQLQRLSGVRNVATGAYPAQEVRVSLDQEKMRNLGITVSQISDAVKATSANIPGGAVIEGNRRFNVKTGTDYSSVDDIRSTVVRSCGGRSMHLDDIASVRMTNAQQTYRGRFNGVPAVFITVVQKQGTNIFKVSDAVRKQVAAFTKTLPPPMKIGYAFTQDRSVANRLNDFFEKLLEGIFVVGLVILFPLGFRASAIVATVIPTSLLTAIGILGMAGYELNQISIIALVIALGMLVDDAIVVVEVVARFIRGGVAPATAAIDGTSQITSAITSSTLTRLLAFLPMAMIVSSVGDFIRALPLTVIFALSASLLFALILTPFLCSRYFKNPSSVKNTVAMRHIEHFSHGPYKRWLEAALRHPGRVLIIATTLFTGSLALFPIIGVSLFPKAEKAQLLVDIETPQGSPLAFTDSITRVIESSLAKEPLVDNYASNIGKGNPRIYYNMFSNWESPTFAEILIELKTVKRSAIERLMRDLRDKCASIPDAVVKIMDFSQGPPVEAPIAMRVLGDDLGSVERRAARIETILKTTVGTVNIGNSASSSRTDLRVAFNREKAALLGVPLAHAGQAIRATLVGIPAVTFRDSLGKQYDINLVMGEHSTASTADLDRISVPSLSGRSIPLGQISQYQFEPGPTLIRHYKLERVATVTADVKNGYNTAKLTDEIIKRVKDLDWSGNVRFETAGEQESRDESFGGMGKAFLAAMLLIFAVLVAQFRSFKQPLIIFVAVPFSVTGAILALFVTGSTFSFSAFIGLTSLIGIVVNNSIILVDYTNRLMREGISRDEAIIKAGQTRLTPILLTALTAVGGLVPLAISGSTFWTPLALVIIGGLLLSTGLTLIVVPALYKIITR